MTSPTDTDPLAARVAEVRARHGAWKHPLTRFGDVELCETCVVLDALDRAEAERDAIAKAFQPVLDWYDGDGRRTDLPAMLADAVADLQTDRAELNQIKRVIKWEYKAVSEFLREHPGESPSAHGWLLKGGALRRPLPPSGSTRGTDGIGESSSSSSDSAADLKVEVATLRTQLAEAQAERDYARRQHEAWMWGGPSIARTLKNNEMDTLRTQLDEQRARADAAEAALARLK